jgi:transcriptional regulator of arginine metabolism
MDKQQRQVAIREIISRRVISSQEELAKELARLGLEVNQATLSRDLKELGIARVSTPDGARYIVLADNEPYQLRALLAYEIESITSNETMIVIKTLAGRAHGVAQILDKLQLPDVLGTLAGDNTIFVAPTSTKKLAQLEKQIRAVINQDE